MQCVVFEAGTIGYTEALELQNLVELRRRDETSDILLMLEHPPVLTIGRDGGHEHIKVQSDKLREQGVEVHTTNRGGNVTYHGPGQLVGYPILNLHNMKTDAHWYLRTLESVLIGTLGKFDIEAGRVAGKTGVWVGGEKIASIGVAIRHWITHHGFALNIAPDLSHFEWINPCGYPDAVMTSIQKLKPDFVFTRASNAKLFAYSVVKQRVIAALTEECGMQFNREMVTGDWESFRVEVLQQPPDVAAVQERQGNRVRS